MSAIRLQPKQSALLDAILDTNGPTVIGFGGSRGAAKSGGVRRIAMLLATEHPGTICWIIRRVWDDLNKDHVKPLFVEFPDFAQYWHAGDKELRLPGGSSIFFIHAGDTGRAKRKSRGPQAHYIFLEQAEEFSQQEMEQLAGSNRAPGVKPGVCKRIYTFNPGGIGTLYLRRIFHLREYADNERAEDFMFIQGFGWDNYEWFRGLDIVSEEDFYGLPEWDSDKRFQVFIEQTDFGQKLNALPPSQRIGELMGDFQNFAGQYYADVWEEKSIVLAPGVDRLMVQPWWPRWMATDWGFSHWAATGWAATGLLSPNQVAKLFGVETTANCRVIVLYREAIVNELPEPELAQLVVAMTPEAEKKEVREYFGGADMFFGRKPNLGHSIAEQMDPILQRGGLRRLSRADVDRVGGWRLLYNCLGAARKLRRNGTVPTEDAPALFISPECPEIVQALPMLMAGDPAQGQNPKDVVKNAGQVWDDVGDMVRYLLKSYLAAEPKAPPEVERMETYQAYEDPTARAMAMLRLSAKQDESRYIRRRRRA